MTRSIIRLSGVLAVLLIALLANLTYIQVFKADAYRTATGNPGRAGGVLTRTGSDPGRARSRGRECRDRRRTEVPAGSTRRAS